MEVEELAEESEEELVLELSLEELDFDGELAVEELSELAPESLPPESFLVEE